MEGVFAILSAPLILFLVFVAPIWLILHYRSRNKISSGLNENERETLRQLAQTAERMQDRVRTLESILDAEHPNWRRQHEDRNHG
ncbi:envelope stress response membrane protein PspB [Aliidiomarina maris]|uniref:Envelope stress response membrane protein PspB n=1 Tax=Aliidiomarina maris TaxID=531312 RepID=A0A327X2Z0_9GAMM|nr:envelope stress response membrane protein PspB [Aliidiomarina maris]MBA3987727.1 envelope stress response membrane protein PspB [Idiomarina sp.]RAK01450.1 phage shock protein B [Aliidiomarina maris]RUO28697.1 envelope stress response membrane protein PspB [Aliidiomarina maris]